MVALLLEGTDLESFDGDIYTNRDELSEDISFNILEQQDIITDKHDSEFVEFCGKHGFNVIHIDDYLKSHSNINNSEDGTSICENRDGLVDSNVNTEEDNIVEVEQQIDTCDIAEQVEVKEINSTDVEECSVGVKSEQPLDTIDKQQQEECLVDDVSRDSLVDSGVIVEEQTPTTSENLPVVSASINKEKKSVLSKFKTIFKRKHVELEELSISAIDNLNMGALTNDISRGKQFREYLVDKGFMTKEQVQIVLDKQEEARRYSRKRRFIELAIECGFITDVDGCNVLSKSLNREVKPLSQLDLKKIINLTTPYYDHSNDFNFVYLDIDRDAKTLVVGHDLTVKANYYKIEERFADYKVTYRYFIEGTTSKILCRIV